MFGKKIKDHTLLKLFIENKQAHKNNDGNYDIIKTKDVALEYCYWRSNHPHGYNEFTLWGGPTIFGPSFTFMGFYDHNYSNTPLNGLNPGIHISLEVYQLIDFEFYFIYEHEMYHMMKYMQYCEDNKFSNKDNDYAFIRENNSLKREMECDDHSMCCLPREGRLHMLFKFFIPLLFNCIFNYKTIVNNVISDIVSSKMPEYRKIENIVLLGKLKKVDHKLFWETYKNIVIPYMKRSLHQIEQILYYIIKK